MHRIFIFNRENISYIALKVVPKAHDKLYRGD